MEKSVVRISGGAVTWIGLGWTHFGCFIRDGGQTQALDEIDLAFESVHLPLQLGDLVFEFVEFLSLRLHFGNLIVIKLLAESKTLGNKQKSKHPLSFFP